MLGQLLLRTDHRLRHGVSHVLPMDLERLTC